MKKAKEHIKIVGINARYTHSCLALFYVRNELEKNCPDMEGELCQFTINDNYYEMVIRLSAGSPRYVFFSAAIWNSSLVEKLTRDLRVCLPHCRIVIGGPQAEVLANRLGPDNCTAVLGEIEGIGEVFYQDLEEGKLQPLYVGSFFSLPKRFFDYPYRENDFADHLRNRHIYYESSRGCPFGCSYCLSAAEKGLYYKEIEVVEKELADILYHRPKVVRFIDRTFNDRPDRALAIWRFLAAEGGDTLFHFEMAPDRFSEEMFAFLATLKPGRFQFELGIQSTNPATLLAVNRRVDPAEAQDTVARLAAFGNIHLHVDLILALPFETKETFAESFRAVFSMGAHYIQMGLLKILPDTPICHEAGEFGYRHCNEPPYAVLENRWMDHSTVGELYWFSEMVEKFMNNRYFVTLWKYLRRRRENGFDFFQRLLVFCHDCGFFQLAATQELLCKLLVKLADERNDGRLIIELLRYDWLRCGFRFLPDCLQQDGFLEKPEVTRSTFYQSLPEELPGVYGRASRNQFFRKSFFLRVSLEAITEIDFKEKTENCCLCILAEREYGLFGFNKVLLF
ncbi:MAG: DUF4080 domain-containing protein [Proteobacteria bacterium]|nr:DUF4080 domain-containing protein [Pseudomonadota bacterium]